MKRGLLICIHVWIAQIIHAQSTLQLSSPDKKILVEIKTTGILKYSDL